MNSKFPEVVKIIKKHNALLPLIRNVYRTGAYNLDGHFRWSLTLQGHELWSKIYWELDALNLEHITFTKHDLIKFIPIKGLK